MDNCGKDFETAIEHRQAVVTLAIRRVVCGVVRDRASSEPAHKDMNPKAAEAWNFALAKMESARQLIKQEQSEQAKTEIAKAVYVGAGALYYLLGPGQEEQVAYQAAQSFIADMAGEDSSSAEALAAANKILTYIAAISPSEDRLPAP